MKPMQERVVEEKEELDVRISNLKALIASTTFNLVDAQEQDRLVLQLSVMQTYAFILAQRIKAFI